MQVRNRKVKEAIEKLEKIYKDCAFDLRTDNAVPHKTSKKYILYAPIWKGFGKTSLYGQYVDSFETQKEFIEYVENIIRSR